MFRKRIALWFLFSSVLLATAYPQAIQPREKPIRVGGDIETPRKVRQVPAVYPQAASLLWVQGMVLLEVVVDTRGTVSTVRVLRSIPLLDQAAMESVRQWKYELTLLDGRPVPVVMTVSVTFVLKDVTPLMMAANTGDVETVRALLDDDSDVNAKTNNGGTALFAAAKKGYAEIVRILLDRGADANARDQNGRTALHVGAEDGHSDVVRALSKESAVNAQTKNSRTASSAAAANGNTDIVQALAEKDAELSLLGADNETSKLMESVEKNHIDTVRALLQAGAEVNARNEMGVTALMVAARNGNPETIEALLDGGADVNAETEYGGSALRIATMENYVPATMLLLRAGADTHNVKGQETPLVERYREGRLAYMPGDVLTAYALVVAFHALGRSPVPGREATLGTLEALVNRKPPDDLRDRAVREPPRSSGYQFRVAARTVRVLASVTDKKGEPVTDLQQEEFRLLEDGKPQPIAFFSSERKPMRIGILLDVSGSMAEKMDTVATP